MDGWTGGGEKKVLTTCSPVDILRYVTNYRSWGRHDLLDITKALIDGEETDTW